MHIRSAIVVLFLFGAPTSCTNEEGALKALESAGYDEIVLRGYSWSGCGKDDSTCTEFEAVGPRGHRTSGVVGCGYASGCSKGCTIRTF